MLWPGKQVALNIACCARHGQTGGDAGLTPSRSSAQLTLGRTAPPSACLECASAAALALETTGSCKPGPPPCLEDGGCISQGQCF